MSAWFLLALLGAGPSASEEHLVEASGSELVLADGHLLRERNGARVELGCTAEEGTGRILDLALDPAGLVFVAAERGLFVLGPFVDVLDPVERLEDAPRGRPTSVVVDAERRVWLATEEAVGVLEPSFFWGRTLAAEELPGSGPYRVEAAKEGGVVLQGSAGTRRHDPEASPAPCVTRVVVDGVTLAPGTQLEREEGGTLAVELEGTGAGGATFRYRVDGHHVWRELPSTHAVPMPHAGTHVIDFQAVDQDLDRSAPVALRVRVAYPLYFDAGFVLAAAALVAALALALFLWRARHASGRWQAGRALVSAGLCVVLALQVAAGLVPHAKGWPFVGFGMYTGKHVRDDIVYAERVVVLHPDGHQSVVLAQSAGVVVDEPWDVMRPMIDQGEPALRAYLDAWLARNVGQAANGLQVQAQRSRLTPHGPVEIAPLVLAHFKEASGG